MIRCLYCMLIVMMLQLLYSELNAQNHTRPAVIRVVENAVPVEPVSPIIEADGFSYYSTAKGIYLIFPQANNDVKLLALTGQLLWSGELVSGRFYIPTGRGIYFLRVNNKSYKVSCK